MHELSLAEGVRDIVDRAAKAHGVTSVSAVVLEIGALAAVEVTALRFGLEIALEGSAAHAARIDIEEIPGLGWCFGCEGRVSIATLFDACPVCGSYRIQPIEGTEMRVKELLL